MKVFSLWLPQFRLDPGNPGPAGAVFARLKSACRRAFLALAYTVTGFAIGAPAAIAATAPGTVVTNIAQAEWTASAGTLAATGQNQFTVRAATTPGGPDIRVQKTGPAAVPPAFEVTWKLLVLNEGDEGVANVTLNDTVPAGFTGVHAACEALVPGAVCGSVTVGTPGPAGTPVTIVLADVPVGAQFDIDVHGTAPATEGTVVNVAEALLPPTVIDPDPADNTGSATTLVDNDAAVTGSIHGHVWLDVNHDRVLDPGEALFRDFVITVYDAAGTTVLARVDTDGAGAYTVFDLPAGVVYQLEFRDPAGNVVLGLPVTSDGDQGDFASVKQCQIEYAIGSVNQGTCYSLTSGGSRARVLDNGRIEVLLQPGENLFQQSLPLDPSGVVYDAVTREAVAGARVTFNGPPGFDPALHLLGGAANQVQVTPASGFYQYLLVGGAPAGVYSIDVEPPPGYTFQSRILPPDGLLHPSGLGDGGVLAVQPQAVPPTGREATRYHLQFDLELGDPNVVNNHIPVDPPSTAGRLSLRKSAQKAIVAVGDYVQYRLDLTNSGEGVVPEVVVTDTLPPGLRYRAGTTQVNGRGAPDPEVAADGATLRFAVGDIAPGQILDIRYVVEVSSGAARGEAVNRARAGGAGGITSGEASVRVVVEDDLFRSDGVLLGQVSVIEQCNVKPRADSGVAGARVYLEDGTYVITDEEGKWHVDGIKPGTHVVQLDLASLPEGLEPVVCSRNTRSAGRAWSQFVNLQGGTLWRADFHVRRVAGAAAPEVATDATPGPHAGPDGDASLYAAGADAFDAAWLEAATPELAIVYPSDEFLPAIGAVKIFVKHGPGEQVRLRVNGADVHALNFDGRDENRKKTAALSRWGGVAIREGDNVIEAVSSDKTGRELARVQRTVYFSAGAAEAEFVQAQSSLVADGHTPPVIAVRIVDIRGETARPGTYGTLQVAAPYQALDVQQRKNDRPLLDDFSNQARWRVDADGLARIALQPTTTAGEVTLNFDFQDGRPHPLRAWLTPDMRDWILVGFAEGTVGHRDLSGNMQALAASDAGDRLYDEGRVAFYAKGRVRGDFLLTMAYDTDKETTNSGGSLGDRLHQLVDRRQYFTVYGDTTTPQHDAASVRKLYLKIERSAFYALFGDFDTGMTVTELTRYSRTLNGFRSEYRGSNLSWNAFATRTAQRFTKDELRGDGTSGAYRLSRRDIMENTEKVTVEVRDRFHPERVLSSRPRSRGVDYEIDYGTGEIFFSEAIPGKDQRFNHIYIVVDYETEDPLQDENPLAGGRMALRSADDRVELGVSGIHEDNGADTGSVGGVDMRYEVNAETQFKAEYAYSRRDQAGLVLKADAYLGQLEHRSKKWEGRAYVQSTDPDFGVGQQSLAVLGSRKAGVELSLRISDRLTLDAQGFHERVVSTQPAAQRTLGEALLSYRAPTYLAYGGGRIVGDRVATGEKHSARQIIAGAARPFLAGNLMLRIDGELTVGGDNRVSDYPHRVVAGADYRLNANYAVFAEQELAFGNRENSQTTRAGVKSSPWQGAESASSLNLVRGPGGPALTHSTGMTQTLQLRPSLVLQGGMDRTKTILDPGNAPLNPNKPSAQGVDSLFPTIAPATTEDYTAVFGGLSWNEGPWGASSRAEYRDGDTQNRFNLTGTVHRDLAAGEALAGSVLYTDETGSAFGDLRQFDVRFNYAWRPAASRWIALDRLDFIIDQMDNRDSRIRSRRLVNNFNANFQYDARTQLAFQYGAKYVFEEFDGADVDGYTDLIGVEARRDLTARFDIGVRAAVLHSWQSQNLDESYGASLGFTPVDNLWLGVGYNFAGFRDEDFDGSEYTARGVYFTFRYKLDQDTAPALRRQLFDREAR